MKRVCVTYKMIKGNDVAETCIVLPMEDSIAELVVANAVMPLQIHQILCALADLQGYHYAGICSAEEVRSEDDQCAEWVEDSFGYNRCPSCGFEFDTPKYTTPRCPQCGVKMMESDNNDKKSNTRHFG